jgi:hypothetical protein
VGKCIKKSGGCGKPVAQCKCPGLNAHPWDCRCARCIARENQTRQFQAQLDSGNVPEYLKPQLRAAGWKEPKRG